MHLLFLVDKKSRLKDRMYLLGQPPKVQMRYFWKSNKTKIVCRYENRPKETQVVTNAVCTRGCISLTETMRFFQ